MSPLRSVLRRSPGLPATLGLAVLLATVSTQAINIQVLYDQGGVGAVDPCSLILVDGNLEWQYEACALGVDRTPDLEALVVAAAAHWMDIIEDGPHTIILRFWWHDESFPDANVDAVNGNGWPTDVRIRIPVDGNFFYDATPSVDDEFDMFPKLYRTTHPDEQAEAFSGNPPEIFEVGYNGQETSSLPNDLFTIVLHEVTHTVGLDNDVIGAGPATCLAFPNHFYDLDPNLLGGAVMSLKAWDDGVVSEDCQHLALGGITACITDLCKSHQALMWTGFFPNSRSRPAISDILAVATAAGWQDLDLPRKFSLAGGLWSDPTTWLGDRVPDAGDGVYVMNMPLTTVSMFVPGSAADVTVTDGNLLAVFSQLSVGGTITVAGVGSVLGADVGSSVTATDLNIEEDALLDVPVGGVVDVFRLRNEEEIRGAGSIDVVSLTNNRTIRSNGGHLLFTSSNFNPPFDLDGNPDAPFAKIEALLGDVTFDGALTDPLGMDIRVGAGYTLTFTNGWEQALELGASVTLQGTTTEATISGDSVLGWDLEVEGLGRFTDDVTFTGGGKLIITLNGTTPGSQHNQLQVDGQVDLSDAELRILLEPGYLPGVGDEFTVLLSPGILGPFEQVSGEDIAGTLNSFDVIYNPGSVVLAVRGPAGAVPDGLWVPGAQLTVEHVGADIKLTWDNSCTGERDYEIYEGGFGDFASHFYLFCTTDAQTTKTFTPGSGDHYYLVVPTTGFREGSYGRDSIGVERPPGIRSCLEQAFAVCGPT